MLRRLAQDGPAPTVLRLSDEAETAVGLARPGQMDPAARAADGGEPAAGGCLAIVGWEGRLRRWSAPRCTAELLLEAGGEPVPGAGDSWAAGRYRAPYLRDALLDAGALVETLETVAFWSGAATGSR